MNLQLYCLFLVIVLSSARNYSSLSTNFFHLLTNRSIEDVSSNFRFLSVLEKNATFYLYHNSTKQQEISQHNIDQILSDASIVIIIPGWLKTSNSSWVKQMCGNFTTTVQCVILDWSYYTKKDYIAAAQGVDCVAKDLHRFIEKLSEINPKYVENLHLIGHSLGAHVAGIAGKLWKANGRQVFRITGLDPAAPLFYTVVKSVKDKYVLTESDAIMVDVYHSEVYFIAVKEAIGTFDCYINNGGPVQPTCHSINFIGCSHGFSHVVYTLTIAYPRLFLGKCKEGALCNGQETAIVGESISAGTRGVFDISTNGIIK